MPREKYEQPPELTAGPSLQERTDSVKYLKSRKLFTDAQLVAEYGKDAVDLANK